jgi:hypothetical protein
MRKGHAIESNAFVALTLYKIDGFMLTKNFLVEA